MKRIQFAPAIIISSFLFVGCSSPVYVQKDDSVNLSSYHTYMWVTTAKSENDNSKRANEYADISIRNAVNAELNKTAWKETDTDPDVLISYDILVERTTEQRSDPVYSQSFTRTYYNPYRKRWATIYYPSQFLGYDVYNTPVKEGTVTITMMDANTDKNIWQGWTTEQLDNSRITDDEIAQSVRNIFRKFDVAMK
jgi:hypothetical protein